MTAIEGWDVTQVELDAGESLEENADTAPLEIKSRIADELYIFVDGGDGDDPAEYDLTIERFSVGFDDWMPYVEVTGTTDTSHVFEAPAWKVRVNVTNTSGAASEYRVESVSETYSRA